MSLKLDIKNSYHVQNTEVGTLLYLLLVKTRTYLLMEDKFSKYMNFISKR
jgi:hypothetical protein